MLICALLNAVIAPKRVLGGGIADRLIRVNLIVADELGYSPFALWTASSCSI